MLISANGVTKIRTKQGQSVNATGSGKHSGTRRAVNRMNDTPFMKIKDTVKVTGLSSYYLRNGCKDGTIPHIVAGTTYLINVPALLERLDAESRKEVKQT